MKISYHWEHLALAVTLLMAGLAAWLTTLPPLPSPATSDPFSIPPSYRPLYHELESSLLSFQNNLAGIPRSKPLVLAELLPANGNRGPELLDPKVLRGTLVYLDGLQKAGASGVKVSIPYPLLTNDYPRSGDYLIFYTRLAAEIRKRGMVLLVATGPIFTNPEISPAGMSYRGMSFADYLKGRQETVRKILRHLRPDYLTVANEPSTEQKITGLRELSDAQNYAEMVRFLVREVSKGSTKIGAGLGSWDRPEYLSALLGIPELDYIDLHLYPVVKGNLKRAQQYSQNIQSHGKSLIIGEAWLYKIGARELGGESWTEAFSRDAYSFWAPLDQLFIKTTYRLASLEGAELINFFWSKYFFSYLDYRPEVEKLSYPELTQMSNQQAVKAILSHKLSPTGKLIPTLTKESSRR